MQTIDIQRRLKALGFDPGQLDGIPGNRTLGAIMTFQRAHGLAVDGIVGPRTEAALLASGELPPPEGRTEGINAGILRRIAPKASRKIVAGIVGYQRLLTDGEIATPLRKAHALAQFAHESDGFQVTREYATGRAYEGRRDLGNAHKGDGVRYPGRGLIQITGRANARAAGKALHEPYEDQPELMEEFPHALGVSVWFWVVHGLNRLADADDIVGITRKINGGQTGIRRRKAYLVKAKAAFGA